MHLCFLSVHYYIEHTSLNICDFICMHYVNVLCFIVSHVFIFDQKSAFQPVIPLLEVVSQQ